MYYDDEYRGKRKRRRRRTGCLGFLFKFLLLIIILAALCAGVLYILPVNAFTGASSNADLSVSTDLPADRVNILLLGVDELNEDKQRSDTMIIASVGTDSVKLVSVMRDTLVNIPGYGEHKLNSAYGYGGPEMVMRCVNENFRMNITRYIAVDYVAMVKLVDAIGGIDIEMTAVELEQVNKNVGMSARVFVPLGYTADPLVWTGGSGADETVSYHLNGLFTLGYARIRKIDTDYMRAFRQRKVLAAMKQSVIKNLWKPGLYINLIKTLKDYVKTNLSVAELLSVADKALISGQIINKERTPLNEYLTDNGSSITLKDPVNNAKALRRALYED